METLSPVKQALEPLGLFRTFREIPALIVPVVLSYIGLDVLTATLPQLGAWLPESSVRILLGIASLLLGLILYYSANFWDDSVFDPLYGPAGRWIRRERRPWGVFPAGEDLHQARHDAVMALLPPDRRGRGVYREAVDAVRADAKTWRKIEAPLLLSKFVRSFIWPMVLLSATCLVLLSVAVLTSLPLNTVALTGGTVLAFVLAVLLFSPYLHLRVEHMIRLYRAAAAQQPHV